VAEEKEGEEEGEGGTDRWVPVVSDSQEKEKKKGKVGRCGGGQGGLMGCLADRVKEVSFSFFLFLFKSFSNQTI
jgi:hypothetical protein